MDAAGATPPRLADDARHRRLFGFGLALSVLLPLLGAGLLWYDYQQKQADLLARAELLTDAVEKQLLERLALLSHALQMQAEAARAPQGRRAGGALPAEIAESLAVPLRQVRVEPAAKDARGAGRIDHAAAAGREALTIAAPVPAATGWEVPVSRTDPAGGRVGARLDAAWFEEVLQGYGLGRDDVINLVHADGLLLARTRDPGDEAAYIGRSLRDRPLFQAPYRMQPRGTYAAASVLDGVRRQVVFRRVPGTQLIILVGSAQRAVMATWLAFAAVTLGLAVLLGGVWAWLIRHFAQARARQAQLLAALDATTGKLLQANSMARIGHWAWDPATGEVEWSDEVYRLYGLERGSFTPTFDGVFARIHPEDAPRLRRLAAELERSGETHAKTEFRIHRGDGAIRTISLRAQVDTGPDGRRRIRGVQQDITDLSDARERLRATEAQYRFLFEHNPMPMWVFDRETLRFLAVNDAMLRHYGYGREELLAMDILRIRPPQDAAAVRTAALEHAEQRPQGHVWTHLRRDGSFLRVAIHTHDIDFEGRPARLVAAQDVTERERSEQRFRLVARATSDAVYDLDVGSGALWWSDSFYSVFGYDRAAVPPTLEAWAALVHPDDLARVNDSLGAAFASAACEWEEEYRFRRGDDSYAEVVDRGFLLRDDQGRALRMVGGMLDVSEKRRSEADLRLLRRAVESTDNGIVIADARAPDHPVVYVNAAFEAITGYAAAEILGHNCRVLQRDDRDQAALEAIRHGLRDAREVRALLRNYRKDGSLFWNDFHVAPVRDEEGVLTHFVGVLSDVSERHRYEEQLAYRATHDELTGLPNRQLLVDRLQQAIRNAERYGREVAVVFVDLDDFKLINDSLGHSAGDDALRLVARRLERLVRDTDTVGRFGGDEFVIVLTEQTDEAGMARVIQRITSALSQPLDIAGIAHTLTPSIGHCRYPEAGRDAETLLMHADLAMYQAKRQGRNRAVAYRAEFDSTVSQRLQLVARLREALERKEFALEFQPLFDTAGRPVALEALVRWQHPEQGLLLPGQFLGVCEESGLIVELGRRVLREAARHYAMLVAVGLGHMRIAVNVSATQFSHDLHADVERVVREFALPPGSLELEITESVIMDNPTLAIATMERIAALGVCMAVDDFGTGYSSLSYLKRLPIDRLKIDRSFVHDLPGDEDDAAICTSIIGLAHSLGLVTVAEGVETEEQLAWLRARGCDELQGFLLGRPQSFEDLLDVLAADGALHPA